MKILEKLIHFDGEIKLEIESGSQSHPFLKNWWNTAMRFRKLLADCRPILQFADQTPNRKVLDREGSISTPTPSRRQAPSEIISIDCEEDSQEMSNRKRHHEADIESPCKRAPNEALLKDRISEIPLFQNSISTPHRSRARRFRLHEIRSIIQDAYVGLPGDIHPKAMETMIRMILSSWKEPLYWFLELTQNRCREMMKGHLHNTFGCWKSTQLYDKILEICDSFLEDQFAYQREAAKRAQSLELLTNIAINEDSLNSYVEKAHAEIREDRRNKRAIDFLDKHESKPSSGQARDDKVAKITDLQLGPDPFSDEVHLMGVGS